MLKPFKVEGDTPPAGSIERPEAGVIGVSPSPRYLFPHPA